jgi:hypothetical protein
MVIMGHHLRVRADSLVTDSRHQILIPAPASQVSPQAKTERAAPRLLELSLNLAETAIQDVHRAFEVNQPFCHEMSLR